MSLVKFVKVRPIVEEEPLVKIRSPAERKSGGPVGAMAILKELENKQKAADKAKITLEKPIDDTGTKEHPGTPALVEKLQDN